MKVWRFSDPDDSKFAGAGIRGTWSESKGVCPECTSSGQRRIKPLVIEWEPGSDVVGDFVPTGLDFDFAITDRVARLLQFGGFELGSVKMIENSKLTKNELKQRRVRLPYDGPPLYDLWVTRWVGIDADHSTVSLDKDCGTCGTKLYSITGVERREVGWNKALREGFLQHFPRRPGEGLYIRRSALCGDDIFRANEAPGWILCSNKVKETIEAEGFTNVSFLEVGELN